MCSLKIKIETVFRKLCFWLIFLELRVRFNFIVKALGAGFHYFLFFYVSEYPMVGIMTLQDWLCQACWWCTDRKEPADTGKGWKIPLMAKEMRPSDRSYTKQKTTQHTHKQLLKFPPRWKAVAETTYKEEGFLWVLKAPLCYLSLHYSADMSRFNELNQVDQVIGPSR